MELTKPLGYYTDSTSLRFHMLDVGEGLMVLIILKRFSLLLHGSHSSVLPIPSDRLP